jgi:sugar/nucleoside kinase (ribokinase family)
MTVMLDLACFGYLSAAKILKVGGYPDPNSVCTVSQITPTIAADAPIVTLISAQLGMRSGLISNDVGDDEDSRRLVSSLSDHDVQITIKTTTDLVTPQMFIINDAQGHRTVLTFMPNVTEGLLVTDLEFLEKSRLAYIDLYTEINKASLRAIYYAIEKSIPIFVNLSGYDLRQKIATLQGLEGITIVQVSGAAFNEPSVLASNILRDTNAEIVLVTLGPTGAFCTNRSRVFEMPAFRIDRVETHHGAGAAFAAGYAFAYLCKWELEQSLEFACALASMTRKAADGIGRFSAEAVLNFIHQH